MLTFETIGIEENPLETVKTYHRLSKGFKWKLKRPYTARITSPDKSETKTVKFLEGHEFTTGDVISHSYDTKKKNVFTESYPMIDDYGHIVYIPADEAFAIGLPLASWIKFSDEVIPRHDRIISHKRYAYR